MTNSPEIKLLPSELSIENRHSEVLGLEYNIETGIIIKYKVNHRKIYNVYFSPFIYGFRVLDEGDLLEFWNLKEYQGFGIYEVIKGGWGSLEKTRSGFQTGFTDQEYTEYLITGENDCVSVMAQPMNIPEFKQVKIKTDKSE